MTASEIALSAFRISPVLLWLAAICSVGWLALLGVIKLFATMHPRDKDAWRKHR